MRYALWSHGRLVGHTDLDIETVSPNMRQGFIAPTAEGEALLRDATAVPRALAEGRRARRVRGGRSEESDQDLFIAACNRREALEFELRDEQGGVFVCDFMRVYDMRDPSLNDAADADDAEYEEHLASMPAAERAKHDEDLAEMLEQVEELKKGWADQEMYGSAWPPPAEPDPRWDTMQYHLQVFLGRFDGGPEL